MASRLVLVIGDLFIPDRAPVRSLPQALGTEILIRGVGDSSKGSFSQELLSRGCLYLIRRIQFRKLLAPGKIGQVVCLGNLTDKETYDFLRQTAPDLHVVKGDFDTEASNLALSKVVQHGGLRIGFTHGHTIIPQGDADALLIAARQMDVDVLLWGGTHKFEAYELEGKFFINPGSATGAFSTSWLAIDDEPTPSFCLMDVCHQT